MKRLVVLMGLALVSCTDSVPMSEIKRLDDRINAQNKIIVQQQETIDTLAAVVIKYTDTVDERLRQIDNAYGCDKWGGI